MVKSKSVKIITGLSVLLMGALTITYLFWLQTPTAELRSALQRYTTEMQQIELTLNTSKLSHITTGEFLKDRIKAIESHRQFTTLSSDDVSISFLWFEVIEYSETKATIETVITTRGFSFDRVTGLRTYYTSIPRDITIQVEMLKENGVWKVSKYTSIKIHDW